MYNHVDKFKFYITDSTGASYYEENGVVGKQGQPRNISASPDGFQDIAISYERNRTYMGLFRNFSVPLGFVKDGREIIKNIFHKLGFEFKAFLIILIRDLYFTPFEYGFYYKSYYKGELDLSTYVQEEHKATVNLLDGGLESIIKANENTQYEIPLSGSNVRRVKMDGVFLQQSAVFKVVNVEVSIAPTVPVVPVTLITQEGMGVNVIVKTQDNVTGFVEATDTITIQLTGSVKWTKNQYVQLSDFRLNKAKDGNLVATLDHMSLNGNDTNQRDFNMSITLNAGEYLYFIVSAVPQSPAVRDQARITFLETDINVGMNTRFRTTYTKALPAYYVFKGLIEKMTDGKYTVDSAYLEKRTDLLLTSGDGLRGFDGAVIKTSFADFWQWLWSEEDFHFSVKNNKAYIGPLKERFVQPSTSPFIDLIPGANRSNPTVIGDVINLKVSVAKDFLFNKIKSGYENQDYNDVNGKTEFNAGQQWTTAITRDSKELNLVSPYRADSIGIEYVRVNLSEKKTTDASSDNDTFVLHCLKTASTDSTGTYYALDRTANQYLSGVIDPPSMFNVKLSPKHRMLRKIVYLNSCMRDGDKIKVSTGDKNIGMRVDYPSGAIVENEEIAIGGQRYFKPDLIEFETYRPTDLVEIMSGNDWRQDCIKFTWNGIDFFGFIMKAGIQPWDNEVQTFQLLSSPKNDLSKT